MKKTNRKDLLIKKAAKLFVKYGYERTTMNDIADAMGMKGPAIYYYVDSKEELLSLVFNSASQQFREKLVEKVQAVDDPVERVAELIKRGIELCLSQGEVPLLLDAPIESLSPKELKSYKNQAKENVEFIERVLRDLAISKEVQDSTDLTIAVYILIGMSVWVQKWYNPKGRISQQELIDGMTKFFLRGFVGEEK